MRVCVAIFSRLALRCNDFVRRTKTTPARSMTRPSSVQDIEIKSFILLHVTLPSYFFLVGKCRSGFNWRRKLLVSVVRTRAYAVHRLIRSQLCVLCSNCVLMLTLAGSGHRGPPRLMQTSCRIWRRNFNRFTFKLIFTSLESICKRVQFYFHFHFWIL